MRLPPPDCHPWRPNATGMRHAVAAGHQLSAQTGMQILEAGGNAVDAGVAACLVTAVVESQMTGIAGINPIVIRIKETGETIASSGIGPWPMAASCEYFQKKHGGRIPNNYEEAIVPGALGTLVAVLGRYGTLSFADVAYQATRFARDGFPMYALMARHIRERLEKLKQWPSSLAVGAPGGRPTEAGDRFVQADLGRTFQHMIDQEKAAATKGGRRAGLKAAHDAFYKGDIAATVIAHHRANGGLLTRDDLAAYEADFHPAVATTWRDVKLATGSTGGLHSLMLFNMIDGIDVGRLGHNSVAYVHTLTEAVKLVMADREAYIGDPAFVDVPVKAILDKAFAAKRRVHIDPAKAFPGFPPSAAAQGEGPPIPRDRTFRASGGGAARAAARNSGDLATSIVCVIDKDDNVFTGMPSGSFLDSPIVPGTGIAISGYGKLSTADPNHPNCVAPGKRPRCLYPVIASRDDGMLFPFGSPGSDVIPQATLQVFLNVFVFGMDPQSAVEATRFASYSFPQPFEPHEIHDGLLRVEGGLPDTTGLELGRMGHRIEWWPKRDWLAASVCCILKDPDTGFLYGGADPRRAAWAVGF